MNASNGVRRSRTLSCSRSASPRSCSTGSKTSPSVQAVRAEKRSSSRHRSVGFAKWRHSASRSHRRLDTVVHSLPSADDFGLPSARQNSCSFFRGPLSLTNVALYRNVGSRCSIRAEPLLRRVRHRGCKSTGLPVQDPLARKVGLLLGESHSRESKQNAHSDTRLDQHQAPHIGSSLDFE